MKSLAFDYYIELLNTNLDNLKHIESYISMLNSSPIYSALTPTAPFLQRMYQKITTNNSADAHGDHLKVMERETVVWLKEKIPNIRPGLLDEIYLAIGQSPEIANETPSTLGTDHLDMTLADNSNAAIIKYVEYMSDNLQHSKTGVDPKNFPHYYDTFLRWSQYCIDNDDMAPFKDFLIASKHAYIEEPIKEWIMGPVGPYTCHRGMNERALIDAGLVMTSLGESLAGRSKNYGIYGERLLKAYSDDQNTINLLCFCALIDCYAGGAWTLVPSPDDPTSLAISCEGLVHDSSFLYDFGSKNDSFDDMWLDYHADLRDNPSMYISSMYFKLKASELLTYAAAILDAPEHFNINLVNFNQNDFMRLKNEHHAKSTQIADRMMSDFLSNRETIQNKTIQVYHFSDKDKARELISWANDHAKIYNATHKDTYGLTALTLDYYTFGVLYQLFSNELFTLAADYMDTVFITKDAYTIDQLLNYGLDPLQPIQISPEVTRSLLSWSLIHNDEHSLVNYSDLSTTIVNHLAKSQVPISSLILEMSEMMASGQSDLFQYCLNTLKTDQDSLLKLFQYAGEIKSDAFAKMLQPLLEACPENIHQTLIEINSLELYQSLSAQYPEINTNLYEKVIERTNNIDDADFIDNLINSNIYPKPDERKQVIEKLIALGKIVSLVKWNLQQPTAIFTHERALDLSVLHQLIITAKRNTSTVFSTNFTTLVQSIPKSDSSITAEINKPDDVGQTLLMQILLSNINIEDKITCTSTLIDLGADIHLCDHSGRNALALCTPENNLLSPLSGLSRDVHHLLSILGQHRTPIKQTMGSPDRLFSKTKRRFDFSPPPLCNLPRSNHHSTKSLAPESHDPSLFAQTNHRKLDENTPPNQSPIKSGPTFT